jgi:hypothetical protein
VIALQGLLIGLDASEGSLQFLNLGRHVGKMASDSSTDDGGLELGPVMVASNGWE